MRGFFCLVLAVPAFALADNYALRFDGKALARMNPSKGLDIRRGVTMEAWVNPQGGDPNQFFRFIISSNYATSGYSLLLEKIYNVQANEMESMQIPPHDQWTHIAYANNNRVGKLYFNGRLVHSHEVTQQLQTNPNHLWVGSSPFSGEPGKQVTGFSGLIDEVRVWNTPRSEAQIRRDMRRILPVPTRHLRVYLPLDEGRGEKARNREGRTGPLMFGSLIGAEGRAPIWEKVPSLRDR